eukprot:13593200-Alexandrium_andersonii.AAC.1
MDHASASHDEIDDDSEWWIFCNVEEATKVRWTLAMSSSLDDSENCNVTPNRERSKTLTTKSLLRRQ